MLKAEVKIINRLGLHARAAAQLVRLAATFQSSIQLIRPDTAVEANAKSILSVLALSAAMGSSLIIKADGKDEARALEMISDLFSSGFGELG
ncbi:MAG: HPr family phosphocarrier protein [Acidobacteria bacterium]|nr:HPr family phosphocarrier protein [Acidobacteriota bacterium]